MKQIALQAAARRICLSSTFAICEGVRMLSENNRAATYTTHANTVHVTWDISNQPIGTVTELGIVTGDQLRIPFTVYTEANPDGAEVSITCRRR